MADKGFVIQDLLNPLGCKVILPPVLSNKKQFSKSDLHESKKKKKYITYVSMLKGPLGE